MGKHEPNTAKAIANKIKAKGLQKIKYYCEMCKKQCRDDNGFKCHIMSESHQRQALIVSENPEQFVSEFSKQFMEGFLYILKARYKKTKILANTVFQDYIKDREHIHMNGTRWTSLSEFAHWLGEEGIVEVEESDRGVMITYIDRDPETLRRQELEAKRAQQAKEDAIRKEQEIARQREATKKLYEKFEKEKPAPAPIPIVRIEPAKSLTEGPSEMRDGAPELSKGNDAGQPSTSCDTTNTSDVTIAERPVFGVQAMTVKTTTTSAYRPPKRKVLVRRSDGKKKLKLGT